jgi:lipoprotein
MKAKKWIVMVMGMALFLGMVLTACGKREAEAVY